jgi:hypothetical protein
MVMPLKNFTVKEVQMEVLRTVEELRRRWCDALNRKYPADYDYQLDVVGRVIDDLVDMIEKMSRLPGEGGYVVFVYNVLLAVLAGFDRVEAWLRKRKKYGEEEEPLSVKVNKIIKEWE